MLNLNKRFNSLTKKTQQWVFYHYLQIAAFNLIVILLFLLKSAGYFEPFFSITVNLIVMFAVISSIFLLGTNNRTMFLVFLIFWIFAAFLKLVGVDIWAERTTVYAYQALVLGVFLYILENLGKSFYKKD